MSDGDFDIEHIFSDDRHGQVTMAQWRTVLLSLNDRVGSGDMEVTGSEYIVDSEATKQPMDGVNRPFDDFEKALNAAAKNPNTMVLINVRPGSHILDEVFFESESTFALRGSGSCSSIRGGWGISALEVDIQDIYIVQGVKIASYGGVYISQVIMAGPLFIQTYLKNTEICLNGVNIKDGVDIRCAEGAKGGGRLSIQSGVIQGDITVNNHLGMGVRISGCVLRPGTSLVFKGSERVELSLDTAAYEMLTANGLDVMQSFIDLTLLDESPKPKPPKVEVPKPKDT